MEFFLALGSEKKNSKREAYPSSVCLKRKDSYNS